MPELAHKAAYLNVPFFLGRAAFYFVIWAAFAAMLRRWSRAQDEDADPSPSRRLQDLSGPGLVLPVPDQHVRGDRLGDVARAHGGPRRSTGRCS